MTDQPPSPAPPKLNPLRVFVGIIAGLAVALMLVIAVELASAVVHPLPPDFKGTQEEMCAHVALYPQWVLALVVPAWALTTFAGAWTAKRLAGPNGGRAAAITVGLLLTAAVLFNVSMLPYPIWFKIAIPIAVVAAAFAAIRSCCGLTTAS